MKNRDNEFFIEENLDELVEAGDKNALRDQLCRILACPCCLNGFKKCRKYLQIFTDEEITGTPYLATAAAVISAIYGNLEQAERYAACVESEPLMKLHLDVMLPGTDGFEICREVREQKNTPIIMVSAKKDDIDKIRGLGLGADDYMTKPFSPSELVARVKAHMARYERLIGSSVEKNKVIEIRGLKIDTTARRVWVNGEECSFTTKEFDLLTFLAGHPNHVYTKDELFSEIWDMESIGDIATVTVHIKKIREKVEIDTAKPQYIETIWGVGYRFKV